MGELKLEYFEIICSSRVTVADSGALPIGPNLMWNKKNKIILIQFLLYKQNHKNTNQFLVIIIQRLKRILLKG